MTSPAQSPFGPLQPRKPMSSPVYLPGSPSLSPSGAISQYTESLLTTTTHTPTNRQLRHQESRPSKDHKGQTAGFPNPPTPHHSLMSLEAEKRSGRLSQKAGRELRAHGLGTTQHGARSAAREAVQGPWVTPLKRRKNPDTLRKGKYSWA